LALVVWLTGKGSVAKRGKRITGALARSRHELMTVIRAELEAEKSFKAAEQHFKSTNREWNALCQILISLKRLGIEKPDIYLITPFRHVAQGLRAGVGNCDLASWLLWDQPRPRIGTVHTFQGKEASVVFLVLGAQGEERRGAREWAGSPANLINVAVTRAKHRIFVVSNYDDWRNAGCVCELAERFRNKRLTTEAFVSRIGSGAGSSR
jgi:superfamily I DNA and/or RNA helicase